MSPRKMARKLFVIAFGLLIGAALLINVVHVEAADGDLDTSFNPGTGANSTVLASAVQPDGKIIIGGAFTTYNGISRSNIARINTDGSLDTSFDPGTGTGGAGTVYTCALQSDGKVIIGGGFTIYNGTTRNYIARLNSDGSLDTSFNAGEDNIVYAIVVQPDGKIIIGGTFTSNNNINGFGIARLNADGSTDSSFDPGTGADSTVLAMALQSDGKIIIGGNFANFNGTARSAIARLNSNGSLDTSFDQGTGATGGTSGVGVATIALQSDGKIIIGGGFTSYNGTTRNRVARVNADGSLDTSFDPGIGANCDVLASAVEADGRIVIGGCFTPYDGIKGLDYLAQLNSDGSVNTLFNSGTGPNTEVNTMAILPGGKLFIGGDFTSYNGTARNRVALLKLSVNAPTDISLSNSTVADNTPSGTTVGTLSTTAPPVGDTFTYTLVAGVGDADNSSFTITDSTLKAAVGLDFESRPKYYIRVRSTNTGGDFIEKQFVINVTDGPDTPGAISFSSANYSVGEGDGSATITLKRTGGADNRVIAKVSLTDVTTSPADYRFTPGALDTSLDPGTGTAGPTVYTAALRPDNKIIIGGSFTTYNGTTRNRIARINSDGSLDTSFNPGTGPNDTVYALALQPDGKILIGGFFISYNGTTRNHIARLNSDGSLDTSFAPIIGASTTIRAIALQPDGKILIGGFFTAYNKTSRNRVARLNSDGSLDTSFDPGTGANGEVLALALQPDGKIIIGGGFTSYNGTTRNYLARLNSDGSLDTSFSATMGPNDYVEALALQPDGKVVIGGYLDSGPPNNIPYCIARLNSDGSRDSAFNTGTGADNDVLTIALTLDGKILIGGLFNNFNGTSRNQIARLNADGSLDTSFDPGTGTTNADVDSIIIQPDGKSLLFGGFTDYNGTSRNGVARVEGDLYVVWAAGDSADKTIQLPIVDDSIQETDETLTLTLTPLAGGATSGTPSSATLTIVDNDQSPTSISSVSGAGTFGGTATLSATLKSGNNPLSGKTVSFTLNGASVCGVTGKPSCPTTDSNGVATLLSVSLSGINAGTYSNAVGASFARDINYASSSGAGTLTVNKDTATISLSNLTQTYDGSAKSATATTNPSGLSGVTVSYSQNGTPVAHPTNAGSYDVVASLSNSNYQATNATGTLTINKATATVTLGSLTQTYDGTVKSATATTTPANLTVSFSYSQNSQPVQSPTNAGSYAVTATINDSNYQGSTTGTLTINKASTTTTITVSNATFDGSAHGGTATVTGAGGLSQSLTVTHTGRNGTVYSSTTAPTNAGDYTASASFAGDSNHTGSSDSKDFTIAKAGQTVTVGTHAPSSAAYNTSFTVAATSNSGLTVSYTSSGSCTNTGATFTMTSGTGACTVKYDQAGNSNFKAATQVTEAVAAQKANQTITFTALADKRFGDADFTLSATASSGLGVTFTAAGQCTVTGSTVHITGAGTCKITASQTGDVNYSAAPDVSQSFNINKATPVITWANPTNITFGTPLGSAQLNATANVPGTFSYNPPAGTVLPIGVNQLTVTFTPTDAANYTTAQRSVSLTVDAPANAITFSSANYSAGEGDGNVSVVVNRTGDTSFAATVKYATSDTAGLQPCDQLNGVASSRCDYATTVGALQFAAGEQSKTIFIPLVDDSYMEGPETFTVTLGNAAGEGLGAITTATITITDNDSVTGANPLLDLKFFIRQQYIDFLGREPDPPGLAGWLDVLNNCGTKYPTPCDRIEVSSDFFRSPEFQDRGYFIYRFYSTIGRHPFYAEFMPDLAKVSGFLTDAQLESNKVAFVQEFMSRNEFQTMYGSISDPTAYVNALLNSVGLPNHPTRAAWITGLTNGTMTRAQVLRALVESAEVYNKFYNEAFVVMQYFGYLRRDPDILYLQWIDILNRTGDYRTMINGFMNSAEYAKRFGP